MIELIDRTGAILIGTSDSHGGIFDSNGLDIAQIVELKKNKKSFAEYSSPKIGEARRGVQDS